MSTYTVTFGDMAENHVGMQQLGELCEPGQGFQYDDLMTIKKDLLDISIRSRLYDLSKDQANAGPWS